MLCCLIWLGWSHGGLCPNTNVLHIRDLPVVKIAFLLIFSENGYMYFIFLFVRLWGGAHNLIKFDNNCRGLVVLLEVSCRASFQTWSGGVNLPNDGVLLYLQN